MKTNTNYSASSHVLRDVAHPLAPLKPRVYTLRNWAKITSL